MAKSTTITNKKNSGFVSLKVVVKRLQKSLILGKKSPAGVGGVAVPDDVKEGHFAVIAVVNDELKRFVVPLTFLTHPWFLRLLEQAAEEYGFDRDGALTVPCRPSELERILAAGGGSTVAGGGGGGGAEKWSLYSETLVRSC